MCVFVDDKQVGEGDLYFTPHTLDSYESPRFVCQLLGINPDDTNAMDERLTNMCQESMPDDQSLNSLLGTNMSDTPQGKVLWLSVRIQSFWNRKASDNSSL